MWRGEHDTMPFVRQRENVSVLSHLYLHVVSNVNADFIVLQVDHFSTSNRGTDSLSRLDLDKSREHLNLSQ